jgi:hypothetical protein
MKVRVAWGCPLVRPRSTAHGGLSALPRPGRPPDATSRQGAAGSDLTDPRRSVEGLAHAGVARRAAFRAGAE